MRYLENGYIYLTDVEYSLTPDERKEHIQTVLSTMQENPHIIMGVLSTLGLGKVTKGEIFLFTPTIRQGLWKEQEVYSQPGQPVLLNYWLATPYDYS